MEFRIKIPLACSPAQAFKKMRDTELLPQWETNFQHFETAKGPRRKYGSVGYRIYQEPNGETTRMKEEVTEVKANELFAYRITHDQFTSYVRCQFIDQGQQTLLIEDTRLRFRILFLNWLDFFFKSKMKQQREKDLRAFAVLLEGNSE